MLSDAEQKPSTATGSNVGLESVPQGRPAVKLVRFKVEPPPRPALVDPDSQCDCACFSIEGTEFPCLSAPVSFYLELTPFCNNRCPGCGNPFVDPCSHPGLEIASPPLSAACWREVLARLQPYAHRIKLTGGEPTLHPEFESIVEHLADLGIPFTLFSNGRWPEPERMLDLLEEIPNFDGLLISLHGPDAASHEAFTQTPGSFVETLASVRAATRAGIQASLSCIITSHNWQKVDEMLALARRLRANSVVFNRYLGRDLAGLAASESELKAAVRRVTDLRAHGEPVKLGNCLPTCFIPSDQAGCLAGLAFFTVGPWGRVRPCNHASIICGNLLQQSVKEIWHSPGMEEWRAACAKQCHDCAAFARCRGGCRAQAQNLGLEADPLIGAPLPAIADPPPGEIVLHARARPIGRFDLRSEEFGTLLISGNRLFSVSHEAEPAVSMLDGRSTLEQIGAACGPSGLALIASLYQQGMLDFAD